MNKGTACTRLTLMRYTNINLDTFFNIIKEDFNDEIRQTFKIEREELLLMLETVTGTFNYVMTRVGDNNLCIRQSKGVL